MRNPLAHRSSPPLVLAIAAVVIASAGTAVAATVITSKQIKNGTIQLVDLSKQTRDALQGGRGPQGPVGPSGGGAGAKGEPGAAGANGISRAFTLTQNKQFNNLAANAPTVASLTALPAGNYLISGSAVAVDFFSGDFVRCVIRVGTTEFSGAAVWVQGGAAQAEAVATTAPVSSSGPFDAELHCGHDDATNTTITLESIRMWAIPVDTLDARTAP